MTNKTNASVTHISIYPIKSTRGIHVTNSLVTAKGLQFDREFVITDLDGKFITGRTKAKLVLISSQITGQGLILNAPLMPILTIDYSLFSTKYRRVKVWEDSVQAQHCSTEIDKWFSKYLKMDCQLYYFAEHSTRVVNNSEQPLSFADGYPLMGISEASLNNLNDKLDTPINMAQFRPNIVFSGTEPFAEDTWKTIQIGEVKFRVSKPCSRCIFTTVNEKTGIRASNKEPMSTLQSYRQHSDGEVYFGQNLIPLNEGMINVGDAVQVLETQLAIVTS